MDKKKSNTLKIVLIVIGGLLLVFLGGCSLLVYVFGNAANDVLTEENISATSSSSNKNKDNKKDYELTNTKFKNSDFSLTLGDIETNYREEYMDLKQGFRVVKIPVTFENLSNTDMYTDDFKAKVNNEMMEEYLSPDDALICEELLSGTKKSASIYYKVPSDSTELILVYDYGFWTDKKVEFKLDITLK